MASSSQNSLFNINNNTLNIVSISLIFQVSSTTQNLLFSLELISCNESKIKIIFYSLIINDTTFHI